MVKDTCRILLLCLAFLLVLAGVVQPAGAADTFLPVWQAGDTWLVKTVYPSPVKKDEWSAPLYWEYKIVGREEYNSENCYVLEIKDREGRMKLTTRLMYRSEDLSLARAEITKYRRGKQITRVLTYERGAPVQTEQTLTPYDTPVFPLHLSTCTNFSVKKNISQDLKAIKNFKQEVSQTHGVKELLPNWPKDRDLIEVKCTKDDGPLVFVQYWDNNLPWPVYGQNRNMKYWLVEK